MSAPSTLSFFLDHAERCRMVADVTVSSAEWEEARDELASSMADWFEKHEAVLPDGFAIGIIRTPAVTASLEIAV